MSVDELLKGLASLSRVWLDVCFALDGLPGHPSLTLTGEFSMPSSFASAAAVAALVAAGAVASQGIHPASSNSGSGTGAASGSLVTGNQLSSRNEDAPSDPVVAVSRRAGTRSTPAPSGSPSTTAASTASTAGRGRSTTANGWSKFNDAEYQALGLPTPAGVPHVSLPELGTRNTN